MNSTRSCVSKEPQVFLFLLGVETLRDLAAFKNYTQNNEYINYYKLILNNEFKKNRIIQYEILTNGFHVHVQCCERGII